MKLLPSKWTKALIAASFAVALALGGVVAAYANSVNLSGGGCSGYGSSSTTAQTYGFAATVNYCGGSSWRWLSAEWEDSNGDRLVLYDKGWTNQYDWNFIPLSPPAPAMIHAGHEICNSSQVCGSPGYSVSP